MVKNPPANAGDMGSIPGLGGSSGKENGNPLQYSCLGNPINRGAWQATVRGVAKSRTQLSGFTFFPRWRTGKESVCRYKEMQEIQV